MVFGVPLFGGFLEPVLGVFLLPPILTGRVYTDTESVTNGTKITTRVAVVEEQKRHDSTKIQRPLYNNFYTN